MDRFLTVLLPVRNVQATLAAGIPQILEVLSDLAGRFELVIVDDGSTDATSELLQELTRQYPQVRAICLGRPQGREAAVRMGLRHSSGEVIVLRDATCGFAAIEEVRQWIDRRRGAVPTRSQPAPPNFLARLKHFAAGE